MPAYLLIVFAILTRLMPHAGWFNFTAVGGALLYFGARRSWREMLAPLVALMATDYILTTFVYHYSFAWTGYIPTWSWYLAAMVLGRILLMARTNWLRVGCAIVLGPTSFFLITNFAAWLGSSMYPQNLGGLVQSYIAGIPFYRNDMGSTALVVGAAFGLPALVRRLQHREPAVVPVRIAR